MKEENQLLELSKIFLDLNSQGYSRNDSAKRAVNKAFESSMIKPHIFNDEEGDASYIFLGNHLIFFGSTKIYTCK